LEYDPSDDARLAEAELASLPEETAAQVRDLASYAWRNPAAAQAYQQIRELLQREVLDAQFKGMRDALRQAPNDPAAMARIKQMLADLNSMLDADARGEHTQDDFDAFMAEHGDLFPDRPETLDELVESLARRAAAQQRLLDSLSPEQRAELGQLAEQAFADLDLGAEMAGLQDRLRASRPDLFRPGRSGRSAMGGDQPLGYADATEALAELADLEALEEAFAQGADGSDLADIDEEAVRRALGRQAVDDVRRLREIERELERQGYLVRDGGRLELSPKALRRLGLAALRRIFGDLDSARRGGDHDQRDAGAGGDATGASRPWEFGDEQPLDVVRTVSNAVLRGGPRSGPVALSVEDFAVVETERRSRAAVALLVDLSFSMVQNDRWAPMKTTALALQTLVETRYPQDVLQVIGFDRLARVIPGPRLAGLAFDEVQGTNLQHALMLAGRFLESHPDAEPVVLVVTDGEPTAHLRRDGTPWFSWPPDPETLELTLAEVDRMTRRRATLNLFMLGDEPRLRRFVDEVARRNGGRVFAPSAERLGEFVVRDFLRARARVAGRGA
jgi:uncharacterized protein with von Willebrand factor type A (vWA) domain